MMKFKPISTSIITAIFLNLMFPCFFGTQEVSASGASLQLHSETRLVRTGDKLKIQVTAKEVKDLYGIQFQVDFNPDDLLLEGITGSSHFTVYPTKSDKAKKADLIVALIRKDSSDTSLKNRLSLAELTFTAAAPGRTTVNLSHIKTVTTETFTNAGGKKDLVALPLGSPEKVSVVISGKPLSHPAPPSSERPHHQNGNDAPGHSATRTEQPL
ncbi:cohesin domain-containing protein [Paenibacillus sp. DMB20]|uniref:cohesin domain-containing protein n=1 Tax=Paenibacillus sp. DMB20 TaxID=1642570 RepID=UPI000AD285A0|nr:cohesin domain-containing protein [Paenibacillus sp. DMB20]